MFPDFGSFAIAFYLLTGPQLFGVAQQLALSQSSNAVVYGSDARAVTNWRSEVSRHIDLDPALATAFGEGTEPLGVARCVKLNNYWCIKGSGWNGMLGADAEGHVAFASAPEGAAAATRLLRRYYLDFNRRSAQAIVSHWAPAQCGFAPLAAAAKPAAKRPKNVASSRPAAVRRRPLTPPGLNAVELALASPRSASLLMYAARVTPTGLGALSVCGDDTVRIRNYAAKVIEGVVATTEDDLKLFDPEGTPTKNLSRVMRNMAGVEIGPLKVDPAVVQAGIDRATLSALLAASLIALREITMVAALK